MADYKKIISDIHDGEASGYITDEHGYITIDPKTRQLSIPTDFNSVIAYAGDINSQIIRFICPNTYDGHSLSDCSNHEIRWYNTGSGIGDTSELIVGDKVSDGFVISWLVPPEAVTKSGFLHIVISIFDKNGEVIKYQWNTAPFTSLSIGTTMENVDVKTPTKDKILILNPQTRNITLPAGYNSVVAIKGDVGMSEIFIQAPRYINTLDLTDVNVYINWYVNEELSGRNKCRVEDVYSENTTDNLVIIHWQIDPKLTTECVGEFSFSCVIEEHELKQTDEGEKNVIVAKWQSSKNSSLTIGEGIADTESGEYEPEVVPGDSTIIKTDELKQMLSDTLGYDSKLSGTTVDIIDALREVIIALDSTRFSDLNALLVEANNMLHQINEGTVGGI